MAASPNPLIHEAPAPRLTRLEAAHDWMLGQREMALGMPTNRGVAASDVSAAEADAQVHGARALTNAVLADARAVRIDAGGSVFEVSAGASGHVRCCHCLVFEPIRPLCGDREHGFLDVERPEYLLDDVVID